MQTHIFTPKGAREAFLKTVTVLILSFAVCSTAIAETSVQVADKTDNQTREFLGSSKRINTFAETDLYIEIPSERLTFRHHITIAQGSTVSQVLEAAYTVKHGLVCCDSRDIWSVNGLAVDPYTQKWWIIKVNGNRQNTSSRTKVYDGDVIELVYEESAGYPASHVRLEDWVNGQN